MTPMSTGHVCNPDRWRPLPRCSALNGLELVGSLIPDELNLEDMIGAIQSGVSADETQRHLTYYHQLNNNKLRVGINVEVKEYPAIFYIVETGNAHMIRHWLNTRSRTNQRRTAVLELLLTLGALPNVVPGAFYTPFDRKLPASGPAERELTNIMGESRSWCVASLRRELVSALNLTQRYRLSQASKTAERIPGLQYTVIEQYYAVEALRRRLLAQLALSKEKPLVLGELISTDMRTIDYTTFRREDEIFGPRPPYQEHQLGSPLNNFLAGNSQQRRIVFMDEFEKTNKDIHNTLFIPFDPGQCLDRRNSAKVDCSKTIWILATNEFDDDIFQFYEANQHELHRSQSEQKQTRLLDQLKSSLKKQCTAHFGAPLSGRISEIIPFLPFSPGEQAVISHKGLMSPEETLRRPVVISPGGQSDNLVGNVRLEIEDETGLCSTIAREAYTP
ncbi:hypothetical protein F4803DRAFT_561144 [Xylaria telfairii]|nr:hypothetical protein F4803DRAFT_561144 [Xylaria telfairii]